MRPLYLLCFLILVSTVLCNEDNSNNANVDNLKILRSSVNFAYKAGNYFLDLIRGSTPSHKPAMQAYKLIRNRQNFKLTDLTPIYVPYVGVLSLLLLGLLFVIFVPIVGLCFCFCRCAEKCGGKIKGMDPRHATCKRYTYALFLGIISIIQLAGIVLAFINNQLIHDTLTNPSVEISAIKQFSRGTDQFKRSLTNISETISAAESSPQPTGDLNVADFKELACNAYFSVLQNDTNRLNIDGGLQQISSKLEEAVTSLTPSNSKLQTFVYEFKNAINIANIRPKICDMLSTIINNELGGLKSKIRSPSDVEPSTGKKLREVVNFFNGTVLRVLGNIDKVFNEKMKIEYLEYRMYICIGVCCLLLLIVLFYFLGLCFGQCGERPFEDARLCNRGVGANLMMAGVAFAFLFTPAIMMLEMVLFMGAGSIQTEFCRYATNSYEPGVHAIDSMIQWNEQVKQKLAYQNIFDSIINKCPTEPMALAFNLDSDLMSQDVDQKISDIIGNVKAASKEAAKGYFKTIEILLQNISAEVSSNRYDSQTQMKLKDVSSAISSFSLTSVESHVYAALNDAAVMGFGASLKKALRTISLNKYKNVRCNELSSSVVKIIDAACVTFLWPFNGFWFGVGICLVFTIPAIIFAVKLAGLYRRTEKYSADYEEPDYHSYMGFYTNNADNIPMKRPKSANSNNKNRNSNSNNKASLKQNNPQYLPVYPYDAYE